MTISVRKNEALRSMPQIADMTKEINGGNKHNKNSSDSLVIIAKEKEDSLDEEKLAQQRQSSMVKLASDVQVYSPKLPQSQGLATRMRLRPYK